MSREDRQQRRQQRRIARDMVKTAADDLDIGIIQLARRVKAGDEVALAAVAAAFLVVDPDLLVEEPDLEAIFEMIMRIIELLLQFAPFFV